jgi:hypothetical protein
MRDLFVNELINEVLGPRGGAEETLHDDPYDEYLTGVIVPQRWKGKKPDEGEDATELSAGGGTSEDDLSDVEILSGISPALDPRSRIRSFGLSFRIDGKDPSMKLCVTWGRYHPHVEKEVEEWKRESNYVIRELKLADIDDHKYTKISVYSKDDGEIFLAIQKKLGGENTFVTIKLINDLHPEGKNRPVTLCCIFQPSVRIKLPEGIRLISEKAEAPKSMEDATLQFLYRERPSLARGHMCAAFWKDVDPEQHAVKSGMDFSSIWVDCATDIECRKFLAPDIRTEFVPLYAIPSPEFDWRSEYYDPPVLSAEHLSEMWSDDEINKNLSSFCIAYRKWIEENNVSLNNITDDELHLAKEIVNSQKIAYERFLSGIDLIKKDRDVRLSFCFANRVIWQQNLWKKKGDEFKWRPFQLAFFIMNIEPIFNENSNYRNVADLLWIPTGGGKTEAYLAIMAFSMALRRRKAIASGRDSINRTGGGTSVISRYTLRLLTVQQFRRTVQMVTAAEYLRIQISNRKVGWRPRKCEIEDDFIYGSLRFSTGLWVGGGVTPNNLLGQGYGAIEVLRGEATDAGEPAQLTECPVCGALLSIPDGGVAEGKHTIHLVLKTEANMKLMEQFFEKLDTKDEKMKVETTTVTADNHSPGYFTVSFTLNCNVRIVEKDFENLSHQIIEDANKKGMNLTVASFRASRPGYFPVIEPKSKNTVKEGDFEIYCPDSGCSLNKGLQWKEGVPLNIVPDDQEKLPDDLYVRKVKSPFTDGTRIPISAYTVDEQIYRRCPTIIVGTADKIARLAFEPRAASIFGNVEKYSACYGYYRDDLWPKGQNATSKCKEARMSVSVPPFSPPDLIVQDELHLIDGPLGSMFGLYETIVDTLCTSEGRIPKHIASTATIKHAASQIKSLFAREPFQFPPHGMKIDDNFFMRYPSPEKAWNEEKPGRLYIGICTPGRGAHTPLIRMWTRILKTGKDTINDKHADNFWTVVGYFNAIRELGGALALYRQDIVERMRKISESSCARDIDTSKTMELSSRIDSTRLPSILKELENVKTPVDRNPDAIFTTSMFGTGVDIPHLSLMVVHGQPKTTSAYIQATGRVGRNYGALVLTFLRASRPRDMSHYEMFVSYHHRIYLDVEPVSVSPFSEGALRRASGPAAVAYLRNMRRPHVKWWENDDGIAVLEVDSEKDIRQVIELFEKRFSRQPEHVKQGRTAYEIENYIKSQIERWKKIAELHKTSLVFNEYVMYGDPKKDVVLGDPTHKHAGKKIVYSNAPQSLRDVEETTGFQV